LFPRPAKGGAEEKHDMHVETLREVERRNYRLQDIQLLSGSLTLSGTTLLRAVGASVGKSR